MIDWYWDPGIQLGLLIRGESQEDEGSGEIVADFSYGGSNMRLRKILGILVLKIDSGVSCVFLVRKVRIKRLSLCCQGNRSDLLKSVSCSFFLGSRQLEVVMEKIHSLQWIHNDVFVNVISRIDLIDSVYRKGISILISRSGLLYNTTS